jgi:ABC-2 type transport system permease protein
VTDWSYRLSFALEGAHILMTVAAFYFLSILVRERELGGYASFPFILLGLAVNSYMTTCFVCFAQAVRGGQITGTLKAVLVSTISPTEFLVLSSGYPLVRATVDLVVYACGGLLFGLSFGQVNLTAALLVFAVSILAFSAIGLVSATFTLLFKRGDPVLWMFSSASWLLGGVMYPTTVLPPAFGQLAELLPITHALRGLRAAVLAGSSTTAVLPQVGALAVFAAVGLPLSVFVFNLGLQRARVAGTLGHQ